VTGSTGVRVNVADGFDQTLGGAAVARPKYCGTAECDPYEIVNRPIAGSAIQYFNPVRYTLHALKTEGNVWINSIYGPGLFNVDSSIIKRTKLTENLDSEFRSDFFNVLNRAIFGQPNKFVFTGPTASQITSVATPPRQIEFAIELLFS
jgi:hypothetical protein